MNFVKKVVCLLILTVLCFGICACRDAGLSSDEGYFNGLQTNAEPADPAEPAAPVTIAVTTEPIETEPAETRPVSSGV